jgi:hypothetical protein
MPAESTTALAERTTPDLRAIENVLLRSDLSALTEAQRLAYYRRVCESLGLNPTTAPFDYLRLSGKLVLYAKKDATEQLRKLHGVSITALRTERTDELYIVTAEARDRTGRTDAATGVVALGALKGESLANQLMKAETKAKRRVTLSICGLGMLDETEVETIAGATTGPTAIAGEAPPAARTAASRSRRKPPAAVVLETGSFPPAAIVTVEPRAKRDGTPWWRVVTAAGAELVTLSTDLAAELGRFVDTDHRVGFEWEMKQVGDRAVHRIVRMTAVDGGEAERPSDVGLPLTADDIPF